jgi:hypothetical protein
MAYYQRECYRLQFFLFSMLLVSQNMFDLLVVCISMFYREKNWMVIVIGIFQLAYNNEEAVYLKKIIRI